MNISDYFDPVSLEKPEFSHLKAEYTMSRSITIHTPGNPVSDLSKFDIAIFGVQENMKSGSSKAPDTIREKFFLLSNGNKKIKIADLGNLKQAPTRRDIYFALRDILLELMENSVVAVVLGGSQDMAAGLVKAFENYEGYWNYTSLDARLDFGLGKDHEHSFNYLERLLKNKNYKRMNILNIGHQLYFTPVKLLDKFENSGHASLRLGTVRANLALVEPELRDTQIFSIDMSAVRQSEAPAASSPSPNGFFGHEFCQITRYAGASPALKAILFSEFIPENDPQKITSHLIAQAVWYFIDGYSIRIIENPQEKGAKKFIVSTAAAEQNMVFYKSNQTDRWWMELPLNNPATGKNYLVSCSYEDYQKACTNDIPDKWWKIMRRYS